MRQRIFDSLLSSLEWRLYASVLAMLFLWVTTGSVALAAAQALGLQIVLFFGHSIWYYFRSKNGFGRVIPDTPRP